MIELVDVSFKYESNKELSLKNFNLVVKEGEFIVLAGHSGCGKSTVTRCLNGLIPHYHEGSFNGEIMIGGKDINTLQIHDVASMVGSVFQDPRSQFFTVDTRSELVFTCENFGIPRPHIEKRLLEVSKEMNIEKLLDKNIFSLSSGEKQKVAIASVRMLGPKIMVLDEPSSNLDYSSIEKLKNTLRELKNRGYTIVISEHRLYYLMDLIDHIHILENGSIKTSFSGEEFSRLEHKKVDAMGLRERSLFRCVQGNTLKKREDKNIVLSDISFAYSNEKQVLSGVNFTAYGGEVIAIIGENGAGKTTLARLLTGIYKEHSGYVTLKGKKTKSKERYKEVSFVMQDADYQLFAESVEEELVMGNENQEALNTKIDNALREIGLCNYKDHHPATLSGGQKQRVTIGQSMIKEASIVILDEPTSGLDKSNMKRVCKVVNNMAAEGKTVIVITHDYEFITQGCNRALYLKNASIHEDMDLGCSHLMLKKCFDDMNETIGGNNDINKQ